MKQARKKRQHAVSSSAGAKATKGTADPTQTLVAQVFQVAGALTVALDALAAPMGQSHARWQVLAAVADAPQSVAQIARALKLTRQSVQRVADVLASEQLAEYVDNPAHQRAMLLQLTARGRQVFRKINDAISAWSDRMNSTLGARAVKQTTTLLSQWLTALAPGDEA